MPIPIARAIAAETVVPSKCSAAAPKESQWPILGDIMQRDREQQQRGFVPIGGQTFGFVFSKIDMKVGEKFVQGENKQVAQKESKRYRYPRHASISLLCIFKLGFRRDQKLAAIITPPVNPNMVSNTARLMVLKTERPRRLGRSCSR